MILFKTEKRVSGSQCLHNITIITLHKLPIIIYLTVKIFITKPQLKSYLQSTCFYKKSN